MNQLKEEKESVSIWETADYKGTDDATTALADGHNRWLRDVVHPLIVGIMVGCIATSVVQLIHLFAPDWNGTYFLVAPVAAALISQYSRRVVRANFRSATEQLRFQAIELAVFFLTLKLFRYWGWHWADIVAEVKLWRYDISLFLDMQTVIAFALVFAAWSAARAAARDLELIGAPPITWEGEDPLDSLARQFFNGGIILLVVAGLTRIGFAALTNLSRPAVAGVMLNVLVYFMLGLVMLGQTRFTWLWKTWRSQQIKVAEELPARWVQYSVLFIGVALLLAFVLPTGYTVSLLDMVAFIILVAHYVFLLILTLLMLPFIWLFSLISGGDSESKSEPLVRPQLPHPPDTGLGAPWWEVAKSLVFWAVLIGVIFYVVRSYLRDRPEMLGELRKLRPVQWLQGLWAAVLNWWRGLRRTVEMHLPRISLRRWQKATTEGGLSFFRWIGRSPREKVLYYYLNMLDRAREQGFPRRQSQTPYEYRGTLEPNLPEAQQEMATVTQTFVEARYSQRVIDADEAERIRADAAHVQAALAAAREESGEEDCSEI